MKSLFPTVPSRYLFTVWTLILTIGLVASLWGLQNNANNDMQTTREADQAQQIALCHALADNNQANLDILSLLSVDTVITDEMTPSQKEVIRNANERRKGYRLISEQLFPAPTCPDGYRAKSKKTELLPYLNIPPPNTTSTTQPGG